MENYVTGKTISMLKQSLDHFPIDEQSKYTILRMVSVNNMNLVLYGDCDSWASQLHNACVTEVTLFKHSQAVRGPSQYEDVVLPV